MIKAIASDMDGTLVNSKKEISTKNLEAIRKAQELGAKFIIATGRMYEGVKPFVDMYDLKCQYILMNGAEYRDENGTILKSINIDKDRVVRILETIINEGLILEIYTDKGPYTTNNKEEAFQEMIYRVQNFDKVSNYEEAVKIAKDHEHFKSLNYIKDLKEFLNSDITIKKIITFSNDLDVIDDIKSKLLKIENLAVLSSFPTNVEVTDIKAQKGYILKEVTEKMGLKNEEVMAMGDSFNDYTLFTEFKKGYAMGNSIEEIKELAYYITKNNDDDGVAEAINREFNF